MRKVGSNVRHVAISQAPALGLRKNISVRWAVLLPEHKPISARHLLPGFAPWKLSERVSSLGLQSRQSRQSQKSLRLRPFLNLDPSRWGSDGEPG